MDQLLKQFPPRWQDTPFCYLDQGIPLFPVPPHGKGTYPRTHGHLDATTDPAQIRDWQKRFQGCCWAKPTAHHPALDVEQREIRGQDGTLSLRRHAEKLGLTEGIVPYGLTPISLTPNAGFHVHFAATDPPLPSRSVLPYVELKADGASIRLPPAPGRWWDRSSPPSLPYLPVPEWLLELACKPRRKARAPSLPEGPLNGYDFTPVGRRRVESLVNRVLDRATSSREVYREARLLARLCREEKISTRFAHRVIERLGEEIGEFRESGFSRSGLLLGMITAFERGGRHA